MPYDRWQQSDKAIRRAVFSNKNFRHSLLHEPDPPTDAQATTDIWHRGHPHGPVGSGVPPLWILPAQSNCSQRRGCLLGRDGLPSHQLLHSEHTHAETRSDCDWFFLRDGIQPTLPFAVDRFTQANQAGWFDSRL